MDPEKEDSIRIVFQFVDREYQASLNQYKEDGCLSFTTLTIKDGEVVPEYDTDLEWPVASDVVVSQSIRNWDLLALFEWLVGLYDDRVQDCAVDLLVHWHEPDSGAVRTVSVTVPAGRWRTLNVRAHLSYPFFELVAEVSNQALGIFAQEMHGSRRLPLDERILRLPEPQEALRPQSYDVYRISFEFTDSSEAGLIDMSLHGLDKKFVTIALAVCEGRVTFRKDALVTYTGCTDLEWSTHSRIMVSKYTKDSDLIDLFEWLLDMHEDRIRHCTVDLEVFLIGPVSKRYETCWRVDLDGWQISVREQLVDAFAELVCKAPRT